MEYYFNAACNFIGLWNETEDCIDWYGLETDKGKTLKQNYVNEENSDSIFCEVNWDKDSINY
jgi:hypothetical protein